MKDLKYVLDIQKFSDDDGASEVMTFDEILSDKEYQAEFDRRVQKAIEKATSKINGDLKTKSTELETIKQAQEKNKTILEAYQNKDVLIGLGVDSKFVDFVSHEVSSKKGDKDFKEFAENYLKENAQYKVGQKQVIATQPNLGGNQPSENPNQAFNSALRKALGKE